MSVSVKDDDSWCSICGLAANLRTPKSKKQHLKSRPHKLALLNQDSSTAKPSKSSRSARSVAETDSDDDEREPVDADMMMLQQYSVPFLETDGERRAFVQSYRPFMCRSDAKVGMRVIPVDIEAIIKYYCVRSAPRLPNLDVNGRHVECIASLGQFKRLLRLVSARFETLPILQSSSGSSAPAAVASSAIRSEKDYHHQDGETASGVELPSQQTMSMMGSGKPCVNACELENEREESTRTWWAAFCIPVEMELRHPKWWVGKEVETYDQLIVAQGAADIGIHLDIDVPTQTPVSTYLSAAIGRKTVILLPPTQPHGPDGPHTELVARCRGMTEFPIDPLANSELIAAIYRAGGFYFQITQGQTLFVPRGWWHWLVNASLPSQDICSDITVLWSASIFPHSQ